MANDECPPVRKIEHGSGKRKTVLALIKAFLLCDNCFLSGCGRTKIDALKSPRQIA